MIINYMDSFHCRQTVPLPCMVLSANASAVTVPMARVTSLQDDVPMVVRVQTTCFTNLRIAKMVISNY